MNWSCISLCLCEYLEGLWLLKMHRGNGTKTIPAIPILSPIPFFISKLFVNYFKSKSYLDLPLNLLLEYRSKKLDSILLWRICKILGIVLTNASYDYHSVTWTNINAKLLPLGGERFEQFLNSLTLFITQIISMEKVKLWNEWFSKIIKTNVPCNLTVCL